MYTFSLFYDNIFIEINTATLKENDKDMFKEAFKGYSLKDFFHDLKIDIISCTLYAVGLICFATPAEFAPGGVNGLAIITNHLTAFPIGTVQFLLNIPLILISFKILGPKFMFKTIKTMMILSVFLNLFTVLPIYTGDRLLAAVFTGVLTGSALGIVYANGGSTGGTDFLTLSIKKKRPHFSVGSISVSIDVIVLILGAFAFQDIDAALYGAISVGIGGIICDKVIYGTDSGKMALIITDKGKEVSFAISESTGRGASLIKITGAYTGIEREVVLTAMNKQQAFPIRRIAHEVDPNSFVILTTTDEVFGEGFLEHNK